MKKSRRRYELACSKPDIWWDEENKVWGEHDSMRGWCSNKRILKCGKQRAMRLAKRLAAQHDSAVVLEWATTKEGKVCIEYTLERKEDS